MSELERRFPVYSRLLRLYPKPYQHQYRQEMLQTLADMLDDEHKSKAEVWIRTGLDLPVSLARQQITYAGVIMSQEMPNYVKKTALSSLPLLLPFFVFLFLDAISSHSLYSSWFWRPWVVGTWLIIMPAAALLTTAGAYIYWLAHNQQSLKKSLYDWQHSWPLLAVVVVSFGIIVLAFGHDSVHCVVNNPIKEIRDWHTTLRCIQHG
ncbi:MAG: hypothetical protein ACXWLH_02765 [Candidatus Saccharimonadales bacterium]